jgi:quercetin dioxygenase-like cupin family protein
MIRSARVIKGAAALVLIASACGGSTVAPAASSANSTSTAVAIATATRQVVPATAQGATIARFDSKLVITDGAPDLTAGNYTSTVQIVTLETGGRSVAHMHGGIESIYVLQGTIDFRLAGGTRVILNHGQGAVVPPGTVLQAINGGNAIAKFLAFMMTADTAPFQTNVDVAP